MKRFKEYKPPEDHQGNDFHRRKADADWQNELIRGHKRKLQNAAEWLRRARYAKGGLAKRLRKQADTELQSEDHE